MKAITISQHGGPEVMKFSDIPLPEVGPDQVLVQISAVGVNFIDIYQRSGLYPLELPAIPGLEGAGQVIKSRRQVKNFKPGDNVAFCDTLGAYAEYAVVLADRLVAIPDSLLPSHAAAIILQGITGCYLSTETYSLKPGDRLPHSCCGRGRWAITSTGGCSRRRLHYRNHINGKKGEKGRLSGLGKRLACLYQMAEWGRIVKHNNLGIQQGFLVRAPPGDKNYSQFHLKTHKSQPLNRIRHELSN